MARVVKKSNSTKFIQSAIKREGALTKLVGGKPSENVAKVKRIAQTGTPLQKRQANFFLNVLLPLARKKRQSRSMLRS